VLTVFSNFGICGLHRISPDGSFTRSSVDCTGNGDIPFPTPLAPDRHTCSLPPSDSAPHALMDDDHHLLSNRVSSIQLLQWVCRPWFVFATCLSSTLAHSRSLCDITVCHLACRKIFVLSETQLNFVALSSILQLNFIKNVYGIYAFRVLIPTLLLTLQFILYIRTRNWTRERFPGRRWMHIVGGFDLRRNEYCTPDCACIPSTRKCVFAIVHVYGGVPILHLAWSDNLHRTCGAAQHDCQVALPAILAGLKRLKPTRTHISILQAKPAYQSFDSSRRIFCGAACTASQQPRLAQAPMECLSRRTAMKSRMPAFPFATCRNNSMDSRSHSSVISTRA